MELANAQTLIAPQPATNLKELGISGPVKRIIEYAYEANEDTTKRRWKTISEFDRSGNLLNEATYSPRGAQLSKCIFDYTKNDTVIIRQFNYKGKLANSLILRYNRQGRLSEADQYTPPMIFVVFKTVFKYDAKGNEIAYCYYDSTKALRETDTVFYNNANQKIETEFHGGLAEIYPKAVYKYDNSGDLIEEQDIDKDDVTVLNEVKYAEFDMYRNWLIKSTINDPQGTGAAFLSDLFNHQTKIKTSAADFKSQEITEREIKYFD